MSRGMKRSVMTTIEITGTHIKLVQAVSSRGGTVVRYCRVAPLEGRAVDDVTQRLRAMTARLKVNPRALIVVVSRSVVVMKQLRLPSQDPAEVRRMIGLQAVSHLPCVREAMVFDVAALRPGSAGYTLALWVATYKDRMKNILAAFQKAGLGVPKLTLSSHGICHWAIARDPSLLSGDGGNGVTALVNMDFGNSEICFCQGGRLVVSFCLEGHQAGPEAKTPLAAIKRAVRFFEMKNPGLVLGAMVIISDSPVAGPLRVELKDYYHLPVTVLNSWDDPALRHDLLVHAGGQARGCSLAACLGHLQTKGRDHLNLISQDMAIEKVMKEHNRDLRRGVSFLLLAMTLTVSLRVMDLYQRESRVGRAKDLLARNRAVALMAEARIRFINDVVIKTNERYLILDVIRELYVLMPEGVFLRSLSLDPEGVLTLEGSGDSGTEVNALHKRLMGSALFADVTLQHVTRRKRYTQEHMDFKMTCALAQHGDGRHDGG